MDPGGLYCVRNLGLRFRVVACVCCYMLWRDSSMAVAACGMEHVSMQNCSASMQREA